MGVEYERTGIPRKELVEAKRNVILKRSPSKHEVGGEAGDARVVWEDPKIDQSTTLVDDLLYTAWVREGGELDVFGPEF